MKSQRETLSSSISSRAALLQSSNTGIIAVHGRVDNVYVRSWYLFLHLKGQRQQKTLHLRSSAADIMFTCVPTSYLYLFTAVEYLLHTAVHEITSFSPIEKHTRPQNSAQREFFKPTSTSSMSSRGRPSRPAFFTASDQPPAVDDQTPAAAAAAAAAAAGQVTTA